MGLKIRQFCLSSRSEERLLFARWRLEFSRWLFFLFVIVGFVYCTRDNVDSEYLSNEIKSQAIELKGKVLDSSYRFIRAKEFFVYHDSILVVLNKPHRGGGFVDLFDLNSKTTLRSFFRMGNGPGELLNAIAHLHGKELIVHDFAKHQIASIDLDSALISSSYRPSSPLKFSNDVGSPFVTFLDSARMIMLNPYYFDNEDLGIDNDVPRFLVRETRKNSPVCEMALPQLYYTYNVSQGFIIPNIEKNRIIYASNFYDELEIYDKNLNLLKRIEGPDKLRPVYRMHGKEIIFDKIVPYSYRSYAMTDSSFYLSYIGDYYVSRKSKLQNFDSWIFKFDWDGNFIECYHSKEYISSLSLSDVDVKFYGRGFDRDGTPIVWELTKTGK